MGKTKELEMEYEAYIQGICNTDYEYQGEEGLMRAYEDFPFEEWLEWKNNPDKPSIPLKDLLKDIEGL